MEPEALRLLSTCDLLGELDPDELGRVAGLARRVRQPAEAVVFFEGDPPDALYLVLRGEIRITQHGDDGRELIVNRLGPGSAFGEIALLDGAPRSASAVAGVDSELLRIPRHAFQRLLAERPTLAQAVIRLLCRRLRDNSARLAEGALRSAPVRVARYLARMADAHGTPTADGVRIDVPLPQATLGAAVGLSRQTVNQALGELARAGLIDVARARVTVRDPYALRDYAGESPSTR